MKTSENSGRLRAASRNLAVLSARNAGSLPARSSSMNVTPPAVPMPGTAGGAKAKACASGTPAIRRFRSRMMTSAVSPFLFRSSQGSRLTK